jgi:hypothetical protein
MEITESPNNTKVQGNTKHKTDRTPSDCTHPIVSCINPHEIIRKYRCHSCGEVMMCACEEDFARRFLSHQLNYATELDTRNKIPVTLGFQKGICNTCRGLPEKAHPKTATYGRTSKITRYYWREIFFETTRRFGEWAESKGYTDRRNARGKHQEVYDSIEREVIEEIKKLHQHSPKYEYKEESQNEVITKYKVDVLRLDAVYVKKVGRGAAILDGNRTYSAEEFATHHFERQGYKVIFTESIPFHALFGIFMWLLIQDQRDPRVRVIGFGDRIAFEKGIDGKLIWTFLPDDFGTSGYALRRANAIEEHFTMFSENKQELLWTFDYWIEPSADLRQYLWAHRPQDISRAREIVSVLPVETTRQILEYLITNYWGRYCGWPDLLVYNKKEFFFAEVKSSKDKLTEDQKNWIRGNSTELHLPFKLVKIHRLETIINSSSLFHENSN